MRECFVSAGPTGQTESFFHSDLLPHPISWPVSSCRWPLSSPCVRSGQEREEVSDLDLLQGADLFGSRGLVPVIRLELCSDLGALEARARVKSVKRLSLLQERKQSHSRGARLLG